MPKVETAAVAPDFELTDLTGAKIRLSDYRGNNPVLLVFNRGFT